MKKAGALGLFLLATLCLVSFVWHPIKQSQQDFAPVQKQTLRRIIVDAGHGGSDAGAHGKYSWEKDISLAIALQLQKELEDQMPEVEVVMTRTTDVFDNVMVKANKANDAKGDLFVSIHCNWAPGQRHSEFTGYATEKYTVGKGKKKKTKTRKVKQYRTWYSPSEVKGTETYIWAVKKTGQKKGALESHEDMFMDSVSSEALKDFNPDDPVKATYYALIAKKYFDRSASLAITVEEEFVNSGRVSRGPRQRNEKGIWVLQAVAMPAILVETGFISNPEEEEYLNSKEGQKETAQAIVKALKRYKYTLENKGIKQGSMKADSVGVKK